MTKPTPYEDHIKRMGPPRSYNDLLVEAGERIGSKDIRRNYSGRFMYGARCASVTVAGDSREQEQALIAEFRYLCKREGVKPIALRHDNMGLDIVYYTGQPDDEGD